MSLNIKAPNPSKNQFTGNILNFNNTSYQPTSEDGGNIATITYQIRNIVQYNDIPSSYFIAIPQGFDLEDASQLHVYKHGGALYEAAVVEDLGYIGINGERMFKISLPETPWYRTPVLINGTSYITPLQIVANKNQLPLSYAYPENGMSLFMELNENDQVSAPTNGFANISEVTLRDGKTYKVRSTNLGYYKTPNEVSYSFTYPSTYGQMNGIKAADAGKYTEETGTTKLAYSSSKELANSKGTIRLANVLTDKGISEYSYNVINLPSIANGDNATIVLTGEGVDKVTTTGTGNGQLLFAYTPFVGDQVTEAALVDFVTADQVTDWSKVKAVVLKSDKLDPSAIAMAELGFKITGIKDGSSVVDVTLQDHFTGEHENSTGVGGIYNVAPTYKLEIQRYVDVTTRWIDTDGNELQAPDVQSIMSGATSVTTGITRPHYKFVKVEGQPAGVTAGQDIVVTYIYEADQEIETQSVIFEQTINYVYAENNQSAAPTVTKTITFTRDKVNNLALNKVTYTPWMVDGKEVVAASFAAVISPEIKGYTADLKEVAAITVTPTDENKAYVTTVKYTKNPTENVTEDKTVTRTINYVYADGTQAVAPNVATKTFTRTGIKDTVTGEITWGAWSSAQEFASVMSPQISGYWADRTSVPATTVDHMSPDQVERVVYTANYSLTERFVDNMGNELIPSIVKKNLFVPGMDFDNTADAKVITGYVLQKIENGIGTFGEGDETTTFIYAKVGNIVPVDENGNALVPPVPYENDKDDPFGVTPHQKVPTIPGYKAEVEFVDPTDPTSDTIVKYVAEKTAEVPEVSEKQEPTKTKGVTVPTSQVGPKATTSVTDEAKVAELPQMGDDAKAQVTGVGAMLVALAGILGLGVKNKRKED